MNRKLFLTLLVCVFSSAIIYAQRTVTGTVVDEGGIPLAGASVIVKGTSTGASTDFDGNYSIDVDDDSAVLVFSYVGFETTEITDPDGNSGHYPFFWTSTTHLDGANLYASAVYIAFGEGQGEMNGNLMDVHGAGCQRSDPKSGNKEDYPQYFGPQGDVRYVYNYVRCVRNID